MRPGCALAQHRRGRRLHGYYADGRVLRLEISAHAGDGAARAHACDKDIDLAVGIGPNFRPRGGFVYSGVGRVDELPGDKTVRNLFGQIFRLGDGTFHAQRTLGEHQLCTVSLHQLAALNAHGVRHDDDDSVTPRGCHRGKADAGVAGGGFDNDGTGLQQAAGFPVVDHGFGDAVFHGTGRVKIFQLGKDAGLQPVFPFNVGQLQQRCCPDQLVSGCIDTAHKNFLPE